MHISPNSVDRFLPIKPYDIPELLREIPRWICWKAGPLKANGKFDKCPSDPRTGHKINGRDPKHWRTFNEVMGGYLGHISDGIGFALSDQHPLCIGGIDFYVTVADFDQCAGRMDELYRLWQELSKPFTEVSPSGNGLHMWGLSRMPLKGGNAGNGRELYSGGRFVTMTGVKAIGTFGECPGFAKLEQLWFPSKEKEVDVFPPPPIVGVVDLPGNLVHRQTKDHWFDRLPSGEKDACLASMLQVSAVTELADMPDNAPSPNWRTVVAACARSGAPNAYNLCRAWAATSSRFDPDDFDLRWRSYARG